MPKKNQSARAADKTQTAPPVIEKAHEEKRSISIVQTRNADLDLSEFDYNNLNGESFKEYLKLIDSLPINKLFDFGFFKADAIIVERYPGLKDTPKDFVGIKLLEDRPLKETAISSKHAKDLNAEGMVRMNRRYYLLKK